MNLLPRTTSIYQKTVHPLSPQARQWPLLPIHTINIHQLPMITAIMFLLLTVPLPGMSAPIEKHSAPNHIFGSNAFPLDSSPICNRHGRHHGHLTFRRARLDTCNGVFHPKQGVEDPDTSRQSAESSSDTGKATIRFARDWAG